jgi:hypothetical protein
MRNRFDECKRGSRNSSLCIARCTFATHKKKACQPISSSSSGNWTAVSTLHLVRARRKAA